MAYLLLSGDHPFWDVDTASISEKIRNDPLRFPPDKWKDISAEAKDFIRRTAAAATPHARRSRNTHARAPSARPRARCALAAHRASPLSFAPHPSRAGSCCRSSLASGRPPHSRWSTRGCASGSSHLHLLFTLVLSPLYPRQVRKWESSDSCRLDSVKLDRAILDSLQARARPTSQDV